MVRNLSTTSRPIRPWKGTPESTPRYNPISREELLKDMELSDDSESNSEKKE